MSHFDDKCHQTFTITASQQLQTARFISLTIYAAFPAVHMVLTFQFCNMNNKKRPTLGYRNHPKWHEHIVWTSHTSCNKMYQYTDIIGNFTHTISRTFEKDILNHVSTFWYWSATVLLGLAFKRNSPSRLSVQKFFLCSKIAIIHQ